MKMTECLVYSDLSEHFQTQRSMKEQVLRWMKEDIFRQDADMHTNIPGVFAAGDIRVKSLRQVVTAAADGAIAATQAEKYIKRIKINKTLFK